MTAKVLILESHAHIYAGELRKQFPDLHLLEARDISELPPDLSDVDVLIAFGVSVNDDIFRRATNLKWVQSLATGVDHFLRCPSLGPQVLITSGRGIHGASMRETVVYLMLSLGHEAIQQVGDKKAHVWDRRLWRLLAGKTVVVVGLGIAGAAIGQLLKAFDMKVIGVTRTPRELAGFDEIAATARLPEIAARGDYVINVLPGSPDNIGLFGRDIFAVMKKSAFFINVGRGETVDEAALIAALRNGQIAGAGLDVFQTEPLPPESPFWDLANVYVTPHIAGYVVEYEELVMPILVDNMRCFLAGRQGEMKNVVERSGHS
jgi:D-2-hydroxyacid dehydrogenase (NADP+)